MKPSGQLSENPDERRPPHRVALDSGFRFLWKSMRGLCVEARGGSGEVDVRAGGGIPS